ncbi:Bromodomain transcription factor, putative isoform 1 [Hibiscus syriacus]|uniref:Bromodomain transcription factor, putative isoform 1 n=1 Tax=Hibiscus syriacus TaxID=106335 RepID=A0A6A2ZI50_HIBSY|nr:Bromodomain transcription factor, putative isoform 1 [Hibiscus syriacus]
MSAKFVYSLSDERPDLQKQIGCMNGLFQLFDRHHFLGGRRIDSPNHKRLPPPASQVDRSSSTSQAVFPETSRPEISNCQSNASLHSRQHSVGLRNVVKDSIYGENGGLSMKTAAKVEAGHHRSYTYADSPRPLQSPKPAMSNERTPREDARRFSYDERGSQDALNIKIKDLPRLSLDSRESSIKGSMDCMKSNSILGEQQKSSQQKEPGSYNGQSSIVAKLMGLEPLSSPMLTNGNQSRPINTSEDLKDDPLSYSSRLYENKKNWISGSPRSSKTEPSPPHLTITSSKKSAATECPIEPAPRKQHDGSKGQPSVLKCRETPTKAPNTALTIYGEIEKRLEELEFKKSGKDLRALKQILEAMQKHKHILETREEGQASNFVSHTNSIIGVSSEAPNLRKLRSSNAVSTTVKGISSPTRLKSPISVVKPVKTVENASSCTSPVRRLRKLRLTTPADNRNGTVDKRSYKDLTPRHNHPREPSSRLHLMDKENACLKQQKKRLELERQSYCTSPAPDRGRSRRQPSRLQSEPGLPHRKPRKPQQRRDDQSSDISNDMRDSTQQGDASSMRTESNMSAASYGDIEVTSAYRSQKHENRQNNTTARSGKGYSTAEPPRLIPEQPSPVSVLDVTFYGDESPSPVKKKTNAFKDYEGLIPDEADWSPTGLGFETDYRKAESIRHLVQKVVNLDSNRERSIINEIAPVCNSPNADRQYVVEILLASGLLNELDSGFMAYDHNPLEHPINRDVFVSLEKNKASIRLLDGMHSGRKIKRILHAVALTSGDPTKKTAACKRLMFRNGKKTNCTNISLDDDDGSSNVLWGELTVGSKEWTENRSEIPCVVLDVERLIFKDLICEVISGEAAANTQVHPGEHCRRLFSK